MKRFARTAVVLALAASWDAPRAADGTALKLPPGAKVAIVMFEDLQSPECVRAYPVVWEAAQAHHIPVVAHDFPLPKHNWSFEAAIYARFFDTKSEKLGHDFRGYIFKNQPQVTLENLPEYVQKFADDNKLPLPAAIDSDGKLAEKVRADYSLGQRIGLEYTPTIFVIGMGGASAPFVEVVDRAQLSRIIEDMQKNAGPVTPAKTTAGKKKAS